MATIGLWQIFELSIVALSREKYHYPGQVRNFRFQFSYFSFLQSLRYFERFFFPLLAAIIRENIDEPPWIETGQRFAIHLLTWHTELIGDIKHVKNYRNIIRVLLRLYSGREILVKHRSLYYDFFP